jgi:uncharacterized heparinase superfamily protein
MPVGGRRARRLLKLARRAAKKPPQVVARRAVGEARAVAERVLAPRRASRLITPRLLRDLGAESPDALWQRLAARPFPAWTEAIDVELVERVAPGDAARVHAAAANAEAHRVELLGSGLVEFGETIDWHRDYKTGVRWPPAFVRDIDFADRHRPSDVKMPWEISRLQWLVPAGQAYLLDADEGHARAVRDTLESWIDENPYAASVNWVVPMEAALRILSWTWFFHVFARTEAWADETFRMRFLRALYLHGDYVARNLERSEINGNHLSADAAGLVFAGLFFERGEARRWAELGWTILTAELPRQVLPDGVDFEASVAYHRLVVELFLLPALYRERLGLPVPAPYRDRLATAARFTAAYTKPDGSVPFWGDADDGRALPMRTAAPNDHRYLVGVIATAWDRADLREEAWGPRAEALWLLGPHLASGLPDRDGPPPVPPSSGFPDGGFYVMRGPRDHVFIDCGPVGLAGRGGHGHNDCLAFEATLDGVPLITDSGAYVYTASWEWRNRFRSTPFHNTPVIDGEEQNRFLDPENLWALLYDAEPFVLAWETGDAKDRFKGGHTGYRRLPSPVAVEREVELDRIAHRLVVHDTFVGDGEHTTTVPYHFHPAVEPVLREDHVVIRTPGSSFTLVWSPGDEWSASVEQSWVSPSYGVKQQSTRLVLTRSGPLEPLTVTIEPA